MTPTPADRIGAMDGPARVHGFTITAAPERRLVGIEAHEHGAFSPEAAREIAAALVAAADAAEGRS